jgi:hypothetical protein
LTEAGKLLEPGYLSLETGYTRLSSGVMLVAAMHRLVGCDAAMLKWWFEQPITSEYFHRWHPKEHGSCEYRAGILYVEHLRPGLVLRGRTESLPAVALFGEDALANSDAVVLNYGRGGPADADFWSMQMVHVARDQDWGCEVRTRFWLGALDPATAQIPPGMRDLMLSERNAAWQMIHCIEEFRYLSTFLPELFASGQRRSD